MFSPGISSVHFAFVVCAEILQDRKKLVEYLHVLSAWHRSESLFFTFASSTIT